MPHGHNSDSNKTVNFCFFTPTFFSFRGIRTILNALWPACIMHAMAKVLKSLSTTHLRLAVAPRVRASVCVYIEWMCIDSIVPRQPKTVQQLTFQSREHQGYEAKNSVAAKFGKSTSFFWRGRSYDTKALCHFLFFISLINNAQNCHTCGPNLTALLCCVLQLAIRGKVPL